MDRKKKVLKKLLECNYYLKRVVRRESCLNGKLFDMIIIRIKNKWKDKF